MSVYSCVCRDCGKTFPGGPRAWYCPDCRKLRKKDAEARCKARRSCGLTRKIGSVGHCEVCGKEYKVASARQRYCKTCAPRAVAEIDRKQALKYYEAHKDDNNPTRNAKQRKLHQDRMCVVCGAQYKCDGTRRATCGSDCAKALNRDRQRRADSKRRK